MAITQSSFEEKKAVIDATVNREDAPYIPNYFFQNSAAFAYTGKSIEDVIDDPGAYAQALTAPLADMWIDLATSVGAMTTPKLAEVLKHTENFYGPDGVTWEHVQLSPMRDDEYDELIADPNAFVANVIVPRKFPELFESPEQTREMLKIYAEESFKTLAQLPAVVSELQMKAYGVWSPLNMLDRFEVPLDMLFDYFRGFKGTLTDLRRRPDKVKAALDAIWETRCKPMLIDKTYDGSIGWAPQFTHIPAYLSPKQFDELYWPYEKQLIETIYEQGSKAFVVIEGKWERIWHHFREVPKDSCILNVDDDDILKAKEELGDHQILCGGLTTSDMILKNFDDIKKNVKRVIDGCKPGGGFILMPNKAFVAPVDINQNLIDAFNFAHEYSQQ